MKFEYGGSYKNYPIEKGTAVFSGGSYLKTHDIMKPLPDFMYEADVIVTDSPWTQGNLTCFYTKAEKDCSNLYLSQTSRHLT